MTADAKPQTVLDVVTNELIRLGAEPEQVTAGAQLSDIDVDSLDLAELAQVVEERYSTKLTGADVTSMKTVGDIVALIEARA